MRNKRVGKVDIPREAVLAVLKVGKGLGLLSPNPLPACLRARLGTETAHLRLERRRAHPQGCSLGPS